jgi:methylmalonyl-CoA mutase, N-terminal domain
MRLMGDMIEWCSQEMPRWHPVSISGYHICEAGSTAAQELAFTLALQSVWGTYSDVPVF